MKQKELWNYFWNKKVSHTRPLDRDFLWILKKDFYPVEQYFVKDFNMLHPGQSMRSREFVRHIHAVFQDEYVFVHKDTGNLSRFFLLGIIHFVFDVLPYYALSKYKRVSMKSIFLRPE